jgi:oligopeptide transport system ATP-binding protein
VKEMSSKPLLEVENLKKYFQVGKDQVLKAVDGVSFTIHEGKMLALVGESGCGKTTVGRTILRLYEADGGRVTFDRVDVHKASFREYRELTKKMQMIFQDPYASLDPRTAVGDIVAEGLDIHRLYKDKKERTERIYELLEMVGLNREHANRFPHEFSGGQRQRIGIARALAVNPKFIVCDEPISALDVSIQAQVTNLLMDLGERLHLTYLFITHDLRMVRHLSDETIVMYLGVVVEKAPTQDLFDLPLHPYTRGLLSAVPEADPEYERERKRVLLSGDVPSPINPKPGCRFCTRCEMAREICKEETPKLRRVKDDHFVACHLVQE